MNATRYRIIDTKSLLKTMHLDGLRVQLQTRLLVRQKGLHVLPLVALQLQDVAQIVVVDGGAVAGKLLLDDGQDLLLREARRDALDGGQGLAAVALLDADMDIVRAATIVVRL